MPPDDDSDLPLLQEIETALVRQYKAQPALTDPKAAFALESAKIAVKQAHGYARNQTVVTDPMTAGIISACCQIADDWVQPNGDIPLSDFTRCIDKVRRSILRHAYYGSRGYFEFVRKYVPET